VREIAAKVRSAGAVSVVDGVSYAPHGLPDVGGLGCDVYLFSAYKTWGPHQGVMVVRRAVADALENQSHWFNAGAIRKKLVPAGPDHAQVAALAGVADYVEALHGRHFASGGAPDVCAARVHDLIRAREAALLAPLLDWLRRRNDEAVAAKLAGHRIMAGGGHFYARRLVEAMGVDEGHGVLRLSFLHYTAPEEVERAMEALDAVL
jgi:selenocysteine lyase/cysteine desulfurase